MFTHFLHHMHPPTPFPHHSLPPTGTNLSSPCRTCSALLFSDFVEFIKRKKLTFFWFEIKVVTKGISLWYFHVYMYYNPNWFISSNFLHSILIPFLWWFQLI
jgi:hypothetical protein